MTDTLLQYGLSNGVLSLLLAAAAWAVHATGKRPGIAHLLWLVVLVKLVTPPIVALPLVNLPQWGTTTSATQPSPGPADSAMPRPTTSAPAVAGHSTDASAVPLAMHTEGAAALAPSPTADAFSASNPAAVSPWALRWSIAKGVLVAIWLIGAAVVLFLTLSRVVRFNRLLKRATLPAPPQVQQHAEHVARQLGLKRAPAVYISAARLSPMLWWVGGEVRVVLPEPVAIECVPGRLRWVLAHELAHVKRRDHLVRWVEWLACVVFWWNPVAWWARRNLRISEEVCCDALVLERFSNPDDTPTSYADAILSVVESLALPAIRPPAIASELSNGGTLQRRFDMILSSQAIPRAPRWASTLVLLAAVGLMPLGLAQAEEHPPKQGDHAEQPERDTDRAPHDTAPQARAAAERIRRAVANGELTEAQGRERLMQLRRRLAATQERDDSAAKETEAVTDRDNSIQGHLRRLGVDEAGYDSIVAYLTDLGLGRMQVEPTLGGMLRIAHGIHEQGEAFELSEGMADYLQDEIGLDEKQVAAVLAVSHKIATLMGEQADAAHAEEVDIRGYFLRLGLDEAGLDHVVNTLAEHGVGQVQMDPALGGLFHTVLAIKERGTDAAHETLDEGAFFSRHVGLDAEQIELVWRLAQRIATIEPHEAEAEADHAEHDGEQAGQRERRERRARRDRAEQRDE